MGVIWTAFGTISQGIENLLWAYATLGESPGQLVLGMVAAGALRSVGQYNQQVCFQLFT